MLKIKSNFAVKQITTARKAVTLLLSYLIFTKPLTEQHCSGLLLIAMGILIKLLPENKPPTRVLMPSTNTKQGKSLLKEVKKPSDNKGDEEDQGKSPLI